MADMRDIIACFLLIFGGYMLWDVIDFYFVPPEHVMGEEIWLQKFWLVVAPMLIVLGIALLIPWRKRR